MDGLRHPGMIFLGLVW